MKIQAFAKTDQGKIRTNNEDRYLIDESLGLYIVCDGVGGHAAGEVAAEFSVAFAASFIREHRDLLDRAADSPDGYFRVLRLAEDATQEAEQDYKLACSESNYAGMATTMTLLLVVHNKAIVAHVGDSRLYMQRRGKVHPLTNDHTLANELLQQGLPAAEAASYAHALTRTIGQQQAVEVETLLFDLLPGDTCLLCSDGLSNYFEDNSSVLEFLSNDDLSTVPEQLVAFANSKGGADNITLIVLRALSDGDDSEEDIQRQIDALSTTFLCRKLSVSRLMRVLNIASIIECPAGQTLLIAGERCDGLYIVLDGRLSLKEDDLLSSDLSPGNCIGESSLLCNGKVHGSVVAEEPSRLMFIPCSEFVRLTRRVPKLGNAMLKNLAEYLSERLEEARDAEDVDPGDTAEWGDNAP